jgi:uncharacterized protein YqjF (DUF2071 family)
MKTLLAANWTNLVVATFETEEKLLKKYLPCKTEVNDWNGKYYMSLVGFMFSKPVIAGIPSPFYRSFEEINLRFYVKHKSKTEWKNGVVFIKEISPSKMIGLAAKLLYHESFISLPMKHIITMTDIKLKTEYYWKISRQWNYLKLTTSLSPYEPENSSLESFIRNHYQGYTKNTETKTSKFEIEHRHWSIYPSLSFDMQLNTENIYGREFCEYFQQKPSTSFLMDGSRTKVSYPVLL